MNEPRTDAGKRLLWMLATEYTASTGKSWPRFLDARLVQRIAQEFVPRIEDEAVVAIGSWDQEAYERGYKVGYETARENAVIPEQQHPGFAPKDVPMGVFADVVDEELDAKG